MIKEDKKEIINNLIKIQEVVKYSKTDTAVFELEPEYRWVARLVYACNLAKTKVKDKNLNNLKEAIQQFEEVKKILDENFMNDLSAQST